MCWREALVLVLTALLFDLGQSAHETSNYTLGDCDDLQLCESDQFLSLSLLNETDCWNVCADIGMSSGMGGNDCSNCTTLCTSCFGPENNQCYSCESYFISIQQLETNEPIICENGTVRNTSLAVKHCVSECPPGFVTSNTSMECICPTGRYQNGSSCAVSDHECPPGFVTSNTSMECICPTGRYQNGSSCAECIDQCSACVNGTQTGCLRCSIVEHGGECLEECPSRFVSINGICEEENRGDLFPINRLTLYILIGVSGFAVLFYVSWVCCIIYVCLFRERRKKKYMLSTESGTSVSESFKKVARNISIKKRPPRPLPTTAVNWQEEQVEQNRRVIVSQSYDPYFQMNNVYVDPPPPVQPPSTQLEMTSRNFQDKHQQEDEEEFYMQMTPAASVENLSSAPSRHKKVSVTHSYEPASNTSQPINDDFTKRRSLPYSGQTFHEEQDIYTNDGCDDEASQENYVVMDLSEQQEPEEYVVPMELLKNSQMQEDEQELYMDMSNPPPVVPRKGVVLPAARQHEQPNVRRKETLDNQYVKITGQDQKLKSFQSDERLAPKYINVQRQGDPRLRSVTSPAMSGSTAVKKVEINEEQMIYQNFTEEDEGESYYGNVS